MSPKGPLHFLSILQKNGCSKILKGPPFTFFGTVLLTGDQKHFEKKIAKIRIFFNFFPHAGTVEENTCHFEVLLLFLSLRYGAYMGRSRLVVKKHENELTFTQYKL